MLGPLKILLDGVELKSWAELTGTKPEKDSASEGDREAKRERETESGGERAEGRGRAGGELRKSERNREQNKQL